MSKEENEDGPPPTDECPPFPALVEHPPLMHLEGRSPFLALFPDDVLRTTVLPLQLMFLALALSADDLWMTAPPLLSWFRPLAILFQRLFLHFFVFLSPGPPAVQVTSVQAPRPRRQSPPPQQ